MPGPPEIPATAQPFITRWDLDKTYLRTDFDTLPDLVRTALERPDQKRAVPGASSLLRALGESGARIHILSGSPRQLRPRLEEKLRIDRVRWDELTLKPNLSNMLRLRFRALRDQLGYKLPVLLEARVRDQGQGQTEAPPEILVGDDAEADAFVYSLYADLCSGQVPRPVLERVLKAGDVYPDKREICLFALSQLRKTDAVTRILIHLDRQSPPSHFDSYGTRVVPFYNYLQAAFVLAEDDRLSGGAVLDVASILALRHRFDGEALGRSYLDLWKRGHARGTIVPRLREGLASRKWGPADQITQSAVTEMAELIDGYLRNPPPARRIDAPSPDYEELAERHKGGKNRKQVHRFAH